MIVMGSVASEVDVALGRDVLHRRAVMSKASDSLSEQQRSCESGVARVVSSASKQAPGRRRGRNRARLVGWLEEAVCAVLFPSKRDFHVCLSQASDTHTPAYKKLARDVDKVSAASWRSISNCYCFVFISSRTSPVNGGAGVGKRARGEKMLVLHDQVVERTSFVEQAPRCHDLPGMLLSRVLLAR